mmetsp:Transcript_54505/g.62471  ORF Transcript_54505/g.62471 Transcript_54505/m.62471 type:complete len:617 (+) Transcript_54505:172-2022(+)
MERRSSFDWLQIERDKNPKKFNYRPKQESFKLLIEDFLGEESADSQEFVPRIITVGQVNAGKSTALGELSHSCFFPVDITAETYAAWELRQGDKFEVILKYAERNKPNRSRSFECLEKFEDYIENLRRWNQSDQEILPEVVQLVVPNDYINPSLSSWCFTDLPGSSEESCLLLSKRLFEAASTTSVCLMTVSLTGGVLQKVGEDFMFSQFVGNPRLQENTCILFTHFYDYYRSCQRALTTKRQKPTDEMVLKHVESQLMRTFINPTKEKFPESAFFVIDPEGDDFWYDPTTGELSREEGLNMLQVSDWNPIIERIDDIGQDTLKTYWTFKMGHDHYERTLHKIDKVVQAFKRGKGVIVEDIENRCREIMFEYQTNVRNYIKDYINNKAKLEAELAEALETYRKKWQSVWFQSNFVKLLTLFLRYQIQDRLQYEVDVQMAQFEQLLDQRIDLCLKRIDLWDVFQEMETLSTDLVPAPRNILKTPRFQAQVETKEWYKREHVVARSLVMRKVKQLFWTKEGACRAFARDYVRTIRDQWPEILNQLERECFQPLAEGLEDRIRKKMIALGHQQDCFQEVLTRCGIDYRLFKSLLEDSQMCYEAYRELIGVSSPSSHTLR